MRVSLKYLLLVPLVTCCTFLHAQQRKEVQIIHANSAKSLQLNGQTINRLIGNVKLLHNETEMTCDSAYVYPDQHFEAFGHVVVNKDTLWLYGDYMDYMSETGIGKVRGKLVTLLDGGTRLRTQFLDFDTEANVATFTKGGTIDKDDSLLESEEGKYDANEKLAIFFKKVEMKDDDYLIKSDSLHFFTEKEYAIFFRQTYLWSEDGFLSCLYGYYDKPNDHVFLADEAYIQTKEQEAWSDSAHYYRVIGEGELFNNIQIFDSAQYLLAFGDYGMIYEHEQASYLTQKPSAALFTQNVKDDTMFIKSDTMRIFSRPNPDFKSGIDTIEQTPVDTTIKTVSTIIPNDSIDALWDGDIDSVSNAITAESVKEEPAHQDSLHRFFEAYNNVLFYHPEVQGKCDSFSYTVHDSLGEMFFDPVIWNQENQMTANKINILQRNNQIHQMELIEAGFITSVDDSLKSYFNQVKGRDIVAHFRDNDLYEIEVFGNGQTIYYLRDKDKLSGINKSLSTDIVIAVENRKIQRINYITDPKSDILPPKNIEVKDLMLRGFSWRSNIRPVSRYEVSTRSIRPSIREKTRLIERPIFPITNRINTLK